MFKTLKSKILAITITVLAVMILVFMGFSYVFESKTTPLIIDYYSRYIEVLKEDIDDDIINISNNAKGLALIGSLFYNTDRSVPLTEEVIKKIFNNYPESLGGGIWFEPFVVDKSQKRFCFYAFRNKNGEVVIDRSFNSEKYNYLEQNWYKQIYSQIKDKKVDVAWSLPYYENQGSYTLMITAGSGIYDDNRNLIGISTVDWEISDIERHIRDMNFVLKISPQSSFSSGKNIKHHFALFANPIDDYVIISTDPYLDNKAVVGKSLKNIPWYNTDLINILFIHYQGHDYIPFVKTFENGMNLIFCIPRKEMFYTLAITLKIMITVLMLLGILIPALLYLSLSKYVMKPIYILTDIAKKIGKGEDVDIKIDKPEEFAQLASTYDKMTNDIKEATKSKVKILSELSIAKSIQASSLPSVFPAFPDRNEFDIFASMEAATEVGGDFYDFFFSNDKSKFIFLIADVSGKGIPAALFMMKVKTLINNMTQFSDSSKQLVENINSKICETNKQGFFVTMLMCITDVKTGETSVINCGHNLPLIKRKNENYEYMQLASNMPLGIFEDADFEIYETKLNPGDIIYTYTDGVTEATNENDEMYGEKRLIECLNNIDETNAEKIAEEVKTSVREHTNSARQSDDITMLIYKYNGISDDNTRKYSEIAIPENYTHFYTWLHEVCNEWNIDKKLTNKLDMCAEEIFANIAFYAYPNKSGDIDAELKKTDDRIIFEFQDDGIEYNPLEKPDPDINLPPEERPLGGLGIFMVKEMADEIYYKRENDKNILTMVFYLKNEN